MAGQTAACVCNHVVLALLPNASTGIVCFQSPAYLPPAGMPLYSFCWLSLSPLLMRPQIICLTSAAVSLYLHEIWTLGQAMHINTMPSPCMPELRYALFIQPSTRQLGAPRSCHPCDRPR
ncbi:uncharacterized protein IWZ02DRAFT_257717 [Phyllosticta citriasiana]|uniref:uncharacterized protein n=1 Tax=Phyllosticta citriasiana TaxID=595635 RepID=UPI0030FD5D2C